MPSGGRAELENVTDWESFYVFNFRKKKDIRIFERQSGYKIIKSNVPVGSAFQWFLHHNYQVSLIANVFVK